MSRIRSALAAGAILFGSSAALLTAGVASADPLPAPAPAPAPEVPGLSMLTQFINPANAPQLLQAASSIFAPKATTAPAIPAASPVAPTAPAPLATAALNLPQAPAAQPAVQAPVLGNSGDLPSALPSGTLNIPTIPGLPIPLPQTVSFPGDVAPIAAAAPAVASTPAYVAPMAAANSPMPSIGALFPAYALP